ncbi:MAG: alanine racemase [Novosphingobium sp.]
MPPEIPAPPLRLVLDSEALSDNWRTLNRLSGSARAGAAVKADGYGLGARRVTKALVEAGCRDFFVAYSSEAAALSEITAPETLSILHGPLSADDAAYIKAAGFRPVINSLAQAKRWLNTGGGACDLMVDTGINRLGLPMAELGDPLIARLQVQVLMSHLASADEDGPQNMLQCSRWNEARALVSAREASLANSAGIMLGSAFHGDLTRPGLSLYGGWQRDELASRIRQVVVPQVMVLQVREIAAGDGVGYNATFVAAKPMRVGVVALGYADGYLRAWSNRGILLHRNLRLPVLGKISMDMTVVDLTLAPDLREGDWLNVAYALPEAEAASGIGQYELLTLLGRRFTR